MIEIIQLFKHCGTENKEICLVFNITQNYVIKICSREILYLFRTSYLQTFFFFLQDILRISALHIFWWTLGKQMQGGHPFCCTFFPKKATCSSEAGFFAQTQGLCFCIVSLKQFQTTTIVRAMETLQVGFLSVGVLQHCRNPPLFSHYFTCM